MTIKVCIIVLANPLASQFLGFCAFNPFHLHCTSASEPHDDILDVDIVFPQSCLIYNNNVGYRALCSKPPDFLTLSFSSLCYICSSQGPPAPLVHKPFLFSFLPIRLNCYCPSIQLILQLLAFYSNHKAESHSA